MAAPYVPTILVDAVIEALALFLAPFVGNDVGVTDDPTPIIRAQVNRVNMPKFGFVELTELFQRNLATPIQLQNPDPDIQQATITTFAQFDIQIDMYGPNSGDWARAIESVFRSAWAPDQFPNGIKPLYCSDARQAPLVTGEEQYENRYVITASLEYNPDVIIPQQSAIELKTNTFEDLQ